jgi:hypothetical protein
MKPITKTLLILSLTLGISSFTQDGNVLPFQGQFADQAGQPLTPASPVAFVKIGQKFSDSRLDFSYCADLPQDGQT